MKKDPIIRGLIKEIEWFPRIEVVVYAALGIKRCSYFFGKEKTEEMCREKNIDPERFFWILGQLNLELKDSFFIAVQGWPDSGYFRKKYLIQGSCRRDNVEGMFLDVPECCAETYAKWGDIRDREILRRFPFRGANSPEGLIVPTGEEKKYEWNKSLNTHLLVCSKKVFDYSSDIRLKVEKSIEQGKLPKEIWLLFSIFTPCKVCCDKFIKMSHNMNEALSNYLSPERYKEIIDGYKAGTLVL